MHKLGAPAQKRGFACAVHFFTLTFFCLENKHIIPNGTKCSRGITRYSKGDKPFRRGTRHFPLQGQLLPALALCNIALFPLLYRHPAGDTFPSQKGRESKGCAHLLRVIARRAATKQSIADLQIALSLCVAFPWIASLSLAMTKDIIMRLRREENPFGTYRATSPDRGSSCLRFTYRGGLLRLRSQWHCLIL